MGLVAHLRSDNTRLREALVQTQRDLEKMALAQSEKGMQQIDFAHLLSLVKDFGEDSEQYFYADDVLQVKEQDNAAEVFAICSPRGSEMSYEDEEVSQLEDSQVPDLMTELQRSKEQVAQLKRELASKDAELLLLRAAGV